VEGAGTPVPEFGSNNREGVYIKQRFGYFVTPQSTGYIEIGATEKLSWLLGAQHGYQFDDRSGVVARVRMRAMDGTEGGITHYLEVRGITPDESVPKKQTLRDIFEPFREADVPRFRLLTHVTHREFINDSRVSFLPLLETEFLKIQHEPTGIDFNIFMGYGYIKEETEFFQRIEAPRVHFTGQSIRNFPIYRHLTLGTELLYEGRQYSGSSRWSRLFGILSLDFHTAFLRPRIQYFKSIFNRGGSPFEFETKFARVNDEVGLQIRHDFNGHSIGIDSNYDLVTEEFRMFDVFAKISLDCIRLVPKWRSIQRSFLLGVELI